MKTKKTSLRAPETSQKQSRNRTKMSKTQQKANQIPQNHLHRPKFHSLLILTLQSMLTNYDNRLPYVAIEHDVPQVIIGSSMRDSLPTIFLMFSSLTEAINSSQGEWKYTPTFL